MIDPECFVIAGGISAREELIQEIRYQLKEILNGIPYHQIPLPEVRQAKLGNDANLYGAVAYLNGRILN